VGAAGLSKGDGRPDALVSRAHTAWRGRDGQGRVGAASLQWRADEEVGGASSVRIVLFRVVLFRVVLFRVVLFRVVSRWIVLNLLSEPPLTLSLGGRRLTTARESQGYWLVAESLNWYGALDVRDRAFTEEHSRDSLENVVFSLCRFYELTGKYPERLTIVSYDFKEQRFLEAHRAALGWPEERIRFVGTPALNEEMVAGEEHTRMLFERDPYGCTGELKEKRLARDPWSNGGYSAARCPALEPVLEVCDGKDGIQKEAILSRLAAVVEPQI